VRDELLAYYERELSFLRQMGAEFAEKYPKIASRLLLEPDRCEDPHVERLLEAFSFLAARIHLRLDDDFPEITQALLSILFPHYTRPLPSMTVAELHLDPEQGKLASGLKVPRDAVLYSRPVDGYPCKFRTSYDVTVWPVTVSEAQWVTPDRLKPAVRASEAVAALRLVLTCLPDVSFEQLEMKSLRIYLNGEPNVIHTLYELLCNNTSHILLREANPNSKKQPVVLPATALRPVGFADDEAMLPYPKRSFAGYRLLQEYFAFPEKFFFIELSGLDQIVRTGAKDTVEIVVLATPFERADRQQMLEMGVSAKTLKLACAPIINLFPLTAEPILLDQTRPEYPIVPDVRRTFATEIFSVDSVLTTNPQSQEVVDYEPFYSFRHAALRDRKQKQAFWYISRRPSNKPNDDGTEVSISLVDMSGRMAKPDADTLTVRCTCTNRDLPSRLPFGNEAGDFELEGVSAIRKVVALHKPTVPMRPSTDKGSFWRLISHMSLNYLSLAEDGREALQEILRIYNFNRSAYLEKQIAGIVSLTSRRHFARVDSEMGIGFVRGTQVEMEFDEEQFVGGGVYLFASILEYFLGLYTSLNSFSQLLARTRQRKEMLKQWPPRAGQTILL
jgi:type VI secretion system protein ImpG